MAVAFFELLKTDCRYENESHFLPVGLLFYGQIKSLPTVAYISLSEVTYINSSPGTSFSHEFLRRGFQNRADVCIAGEVGSNRPSLSTGALGSGG
jgi:hypothetical protein